MNEQPTSNDKPARINVVATLAKRKELRAAAKAQGMSLKAWLLRAADEKLARDQQTA